MTVVDSRCECCEEVKPIVGVASIPGMPISIAWCRNCLESGAIPYWAAVANTAMCGGLDNCNDEWKKIVTDTLFYFGKSIDDFAVDVDKDKEKMQ